MSPPARFKANTKVEVMSNKDGFHGAYLEARVVRYRPKIQGYIIEYDAIMDDADESRRLREFADGCRVRPCPPYSAGHGNGCGMFSLHQPVDAFHNRGWWVGVVSEMPKNRETKYTVCFPATREEPKFGAEELRPHLEWVDGNWLRPEDLVSKAPYEVGSQVEVARVKDNVPFSWFSAVVLKTIWKNSILVKYLKTLDGTELVKEIIDLQHIRPSPPDEPPIQFCQGDQVEALYENGWWPGVITEIKDMLKYMVMLAHLDEEIEFCNTKLRPSLHLVNGKWVGKYKDTEMKFRDGEQVEVWTDEEGLYGVRFAANIVKSIENNMFLVEYQHLKTEEGEEESLKETADSLHIRPRPPEVPAVDSYKYLEEVDAWKNCGWWVGVISKVLQGGRYMVYFRTWKEETEFAYEDLRVHQEWIDGRWVRASPKDWLLK